MKILAGDIGGTKTSLVCYERMPDETYREVSAASYESQRFPGLVPIVKLFLNSQRDHIDAAAFGVAGPVENDKCNATNLPWRIDARVIEAEIGVKVARLVNDLHATAEGLRSLTKDQVEILQLGVPDLSKTQALIGPGTGLGEAIVVPTSKGCTVIASEGGHCDFAPRNEIEIELLRFLLRRHARVSYERVVSGPGLVTLYEFLLENGEKSTDAIRVRMQTEDPAAVIGEAAVAGTDPACIKAVHLFVSITAAEAGNLALKVLPFGGLYIVGGIPPKLKPFFVQDTFTKSFQEKGRMSPLLQRTPIYLVTHAGTALLGARNIATRLLAS